LVLYAAEAQFEKGWKTSTARSASLRSPGGCRDVIEDGLWWTGGVSFYPEQWPVGIVAELAYSNHDIRSDVLGPIQLPEERIDGDVTVWSLTADAVWSPRLSDSAGFYAVGGVGAYRLETSLSAPGTSSGLACDPWLWWCSAGMAPGDVVAADESTTEFGINLGVGVSFEVGWLGGCTSSALPPHHHGRPPSSCRSSSATAGGGSDTG
jgi:opacity protein-like surface antigen